MMIRTTHLLALAAVLGLSSPHSHAALALAQSDFSADAEGWLLAGDSTTSVPSQISIGGNPGGYIHGTDQVTGGTWYWQAPAKFLGDQSFTYGSSLTYDQRMRGSGPLFSDHDILLAGPGLPGGGSVTLYYDFIGASPLKVPGDVVWSNYSIPLSENGWKRLDTNLPPSQAVFQATLAGLTGLKIRGEFITGSDNGDLDNVVLGNPVPIPAAAWLFASALAGLGAAGRRKNR